MKRLAVIPTVLLLTGCGPTFPTIDGEALREAVAQIQGHTVQICSYLPTNDTVVSLLTAHPISESAYNIAKQICDAVTAKVDAISPAQNGETRAGDERQCRAMIKGVCIEGQFIQPKPETAP